MDEWFLEGNGESHFYFCTCEQSNAQEYFGTGFTPSTGSGS